MLGGQYEFDVFISYSHKDAKWVTDILLPRLEKTGLRVCIDNRDFVAGETAIVNMQDSIKNSRRILLVLTPNWVKSRWTKLEAEIAQITPSKDVENRIIPLMWKKCEIPEHLARLTWVDFTDTDYPDNTSWRQLLKSLGVPEEKIRQHERENPNIPNPSINNNIPVHKIRRLLVFSVILVVLVAVVVFAALNRHSIATPLLTSTASITETESPVPTGTEKPRPTQVVSPTLTEAPTDTPTPVPSDMPTATLDPRCIDVSMWTLNSTDHSYPDAVGNCHDLTAWGISTLNGTYSFFLYGRSRAELYGLSRPVQKDTSVIFNLMVNRLREGEFWFGISEDTDPLQNGIYFVALPNGKFHLRTYRNAIQVNDMELDVPYGASYQMTLKLEGARLSPVIYVYGAGTWTYASQLVQFSQRRFYMGIRPLTNGFVDVVLTSLSINP
jgi:hypothetical protein